MGYLVSITLLVPFITERIPFEPMALLLLLIPASAAEVGSVTDHTGEAAADVTPNPATDAEVAEDDAAAAGEADAEIVFSVATLVGSSLAGDGARDTFREESGEPTAVPGSR